VGRPGQELSAPRQTLETERLLLEPLAPDHAQGLFEATVASREQLLPWMPWARDPTLAATEEMTKHGVKDWAEHSEFHFAMIERATGMVLGVSGLNAEGSDAAELHYWIRTDRAGKGLTTEACTALVGWARRSLRLRRLTLWAGSDNGASRRVAEKLGFVHLGPLDWKPDGGNGPFAAESYELKLR
jgi:RimJ/RimL family protein N-acetyltransferase